MMTRLDDDELLRRYDAGDVGAREELAQRYMPLARRLASRYRRTRVAAEDLEQVAYLALLKTIDRYELGVGSFVGYMISTVRGELKRHLRDHGWALHVPRPLQERYLVVSAAADAHASVHGRAPTPAELARRTQFTVDEVAEALDVAHGYDTRSLDAPVGSDSEDGTAALGDLLGDADVGYANVETGAVVEPAFRALPEREQQILRLRFIDDLTQSEIAARFGISQMQVSRLLRRSLGQLRDALEEA